MKIIQFLDLMEGLNKLKELIQSSDTVPFNVKFRVANILVKHRDTLNTINKTRQELIVKYGTETVEETEDKDGNKISVPTGIYNIAKYNQKEYQREVELLFREELDITIGETFSKEELEKISGMSVDLLIVLHPIISET